MDIFEELKNKVLIADGAMGTMLQKLGLKEGVCPDSLNIDKPEMVEEVVKAYVQAGSNIISTNTFGGNSYKLKDFNIPKEMVLSFNQKGVEIAKSAMGNKGFVFASCGTTGQIIDDEGGFATYEDIYNAFKEQILAQAKGGADGILIETQYSALESEAAIRAAKENTNLPVICTYTFELGKRGFRTMMGLTPERAIENALEAGADIIGANCGNGIENMVEICKEIRDETDKPTLINSNAGLPIFENGVTVYKSTPDEMASFIPALIEAGANIIGGCCGTTPDHIKAIKEAAEKYNKL